MVTQALLFIFLLSIAVTSLSIWTLSSSLNDVEAVNVAGSMRMQSYRLAYDIKSDSLEMDLHLEQFERSLFSVSLNKLRHWIVPSEIQEDYMSIIQQWHKLKVMIKTERKNEYLSQVSDFVSEIDRFVFKLQEYSEIKLKILAWLGGIGLGGIVLISTFVVQYVRKKVVNPLKKLSDASFEIQNKNFDVALHVSGDNELSRLTQTFNSMATELGLLYRGLETAVEEKTHRLRHANLSLQVLYNCSQALNVSRITKNHLEKVVDLMFSLEGVGAVRLILGDAEQSEIIERGQPKPNCDWNRIELELDKQVLGSLETQFILPCPDKELIDSIIHVLTQGIFYSQAQKQEEYLILMEERATIARELHDSLAQSLSYLRIQVSLLKRMFNSKTSKNQVVMSTVISDIDYGLTGAYTQLRELLNTFRLSIKDANFDEALVQMITPLREQTDAIITINNQVASLSLQANEQIHVLQLIREAVVNAVKHAQATTIQVLCTKQESEMRFEVKDDGVGFDTNHHKLNHYGLTIMEERAGRLNGQLNIISAPNEGCQIQLIYIVKEE